LADSGLCIYCRLMAGFKGIIYTNEEGIAKTSNATLMAHWFGKRPSRQFTIEIKEVRDSQSSKLRAYYFAEVVEKYRMGLKILGYNMTTDETHNYIKQFSPVMRRELALPNTDIVTTSFRSLKDEDFTNADFSQYIADLVIFAAEHLHVEINDPL
jgi:hypothetical protein